MTKITISEDEYEQLQEAKMMLDALKAGGVDNWEWYDESLKELLEAKEKREKLNEVIEEIFEELCSSYIIEPAGRGAGFGMNDGAHKAVARILEKSGVLK